MRKITWDLLSSLNIEALTWYDVQGAFDESLNDCDVEFEAGEENYPFTVTKAEILKNCCKQDYNTMLETYTTDNYEEIEVEGRIYYITREQSNLLFADENN